MPKGILAYFPLQSPPQENAIPIVTLAPPGERPLTTGYEQAPPPYGFGGYPPVHQPPILIAGHELPSTGFFSQPTAPIIAQPYYSGAPVPAQVPPGLGFLAMMDKLIVKQEIELLEAMFGCETKNQYIIKDFQGRDLCTAREDTDCCTRNCCGPIRPFNININDMNNREVIRLSRPLACGSCLFPCCLQNIQVFSPPGTLAGSVEQEWNIKPHFNVKDAQGKVVLQIKGPFCTVSCCGNVDFKIFSKDGDTQIGLISKHWSGLLQEVFTDADNFGVSFPLDLDVKIKAVVLGALFLIDFMYYERSK